MNKEVPFDWKIGDKIENGKWWNISWNLGTLVSISPCRKYFIIEEYVSNKIYKVRYSRFYINSRIEDNKYSIELTEWEDYNKALKELQDKFNIR